MGSNQVKPTWADPRVALVIDSKAAYSSFPYTPGAAYPEFDDTPDDTKPNPTFHMVRELFRVLELDAEHIDTAAWNPLGDLIHPGMQVLLKPNWVRDYNAGESDDVLSMYTQTSVIRAVLDYVYKALDGQGEVVIGDAPLQSCDFSVLQERSGMTKMLQHYKPRGKAPELRDFRLTLFGQRERADGDPTGCTLVDLGKESMHTAKDDLCNRYRVSCYDPAPMRSHHAPGKHEYLICNSVLDADVVINLPKLKMHKKSGITAALKNMVGIVGHKEFLPHHIKGPAENRGDEYPVGSWVKTAHGHMVDVLFGRIGTRITPARRIASKSVRTLRGMMNESRGGSCLEGSWIGNDTIWRTIIDLNRILLYYDRESQSMASQPKRALLNIVDGIIAGEGDGPLAPIPKQCNLLAAGMNSAAVDAVLAHMVGYDIEKIPQVRRAFDEYTWPVAPFSLDAIRACADVDGVRTDTPLEGAPAMPLVPPPYWEAACRDYSGSPAEHAVGA